MNLENEILSRCLVLYASGNHQYYDEDVANARAKAATAQILKAVEQWIENNASLSKNGLEKRYEYLLPLAAFKQLSEENDE